jgi:hypothetical protein
MSYQPTFGPLNPSVAQWLTGTAVPFGAGHLAGTAYHRQAFFARHRRAVDFIDHPAHFVSDKQVAQNLDFKFRYEAGGGFSLPSKMHPRPVWKCGGRGEVSKSPPAAA